MAALAECTPGAEAVLGQVRSAARITALTATGDPSGERFDLDEQDEAQPTIRERLHAAKPLELRTFEKGDTAKLLATAALEMLERASQPASLLGLLQHTEDGTGGLRPPPQPDARRRGGRSCY